MPWQVFRTQERDTARRWTAKRLLKEATPHGTAALNKKVKAYVVKYRVVRCESRKGIAKMRPITRSPENSVKATAIEVFKKFFIGECPGPKSISAHGYLLGDGTVQGTCGSARDSRMRGQGVLVVRRLESIAVGLSGVRRVSQERVVLVRCGLRR